MWKKKNTYRRTHFARVLSTAAVLMCDHVMRVRYLWCVYRMRYDQHRCRRVTGRRDAARRTCRAVRSRRASAVLLVHAWTVFHATCKSRVLFFMYDIRNCFFETHFDLRVWVVTSMQEATDCASVILIIPIIGDLMYFEIYYLRVFFFLQFFILSKFNWLVENFLSKRAVLYSESLKKW